MNPANSMDDGEGKPRSGPMAWVPTRACEDTDLSKGALRLLILLCSHAGKNLRFAYPGQRGMATRLSLKYRRDVQRFLIELQDKRYIRIVNKRGKTSGYYILHDAEVDAHNPSSVDGTITSSTTSDVDVKTTTEWTGKSDEVDGTITSETEEQVEQIGESRAPLATAQRSSLSPTTERQWIDPAPKDERTPMSSVFPPGVNSAKEMIEHIRKAKAAAKEEAEAEGLAIEAFDAEVVEEVG